MQTLLILIAVYTFPRATRTIPKRESRVVLARYHATYVHTCSVLPTSRVNFSAVYILYSILFSAFFSGFCLFYNFVFNFRSLVLCILQSLQSLTEGLNGVNPLTPKISLVILLTVCYTVLVMLVWRIWYWINLKSPN